MHPREPRKPIRVLSFPWCMLRKVHRQLPGMRSLRENQCSSMGRGLPLPDRAEVSLSSMAGARLRLEPQATTAARKLMVMSIVSTIQETGLTLTCHEGSQ